MRIWQKFGSKWRTSEPRLTFTSSYKKIVQGERNSSWKKGKRKAMKRRGYNNRGIMNDNSWQTTQWDKRTIRGSIKVPRRIIGPKKPLVRLTIIQQKSIVLQIATSKIKTKTSKRKQRAWKTTPSILAHKSKILTDIPKSATSKKTPPNLRPRKRRPQKTGHICEREGYNVKQ